MPTTSTIRKDGVIDSPFIRKGPRTETSAILKVATRPPRPDRAASL
jgi:hypothetical protein